MCGRFSRFTGIDSIQDRYDLKTIIELESNYNTSPQDEAVVILRSDINHSQNMIWGFLPFWSKTRTISNKTINARSDSLEKKYFKHSFEQKRCIIPVNGFFEWNSRTKQPYYIHHADNELFSFAGLYDIWKSNMGEVVNSFTIITTKANETIKQIHDRMPVIIDKEYEEQWLDHTTSISKLNSILSTPTMQPLNLYSVSSFVNSPKNKGIKCIEPISEQNSLSNYF